MICEIHLSPFSIIKFICEKIQNVAIASFFYVFRTGQNHCWPSCQTLVKTIEKPLMSMVNQWKNIQWWWFSGNKTIEKPLIAMVPSKKFITIPSFWKNDHRWSLNNGNSNNTKDNKTITRENNCFHLLYPWLGMNKSHPLPSRTLAFLGEKQYYIQHQMIPMVSFS